MYDHRSTFAKLSSLGIKFINVRYGGIHDKLIAIDKQYAGFL